MFSLDTKYNESWQRKPLLRHIYNDFHSRIAAHCRKGLTLEIGCGIGKFNDLPTIKTDIQIGACDVVADAQRLPFASGTFDNIVMMDVLHHIEYPLLFLREARRVLKPAGKLIMLEPAITWGSSLFYRLLHHEPVNMRVDPLRIGEPHNRDPYEANQAIPVLLIRHKLPLAIECVEWFSFIVYPLSGGFKRWSLLPYKFGQWLLNLERWLEPLGRWFGFRMLIVMKH